MENGSNWNQLEFDPKGQGCGAAMRAACIGLYFSSDLQKLIAVAVETGRTTHHNPIGYLGSVVAAYFTALALRGENLDNWLFLLFQEALPLTRKYIENSR
jgi:ADP-ribosylarginine hydrolase